MKQVSFETTWCDYLTQCSKFPDIFVGSYECSQCKYHKGISQTYTEDYRKACKKKKKCDYAKYMVVAQKGTVLCDCE